MIFPTLTATTAPPSFVLDVSIAAAWAIPPLYDPYAHGAQLRLAMGTACVVSTNWPMEVAEELRAAAGRGETTRLRFDTQLARLAAYRIYLDPEAPHRAWPDLLDLARTHNITMRDAAYLELALRPA